MTVKKMNKIREEIEERGGFISPGSESLWALGMLCAFAKEFGIEPTISSFFEEMKKLYSETNVNKNEEC